MPPVFPNNNPALPHRGVLLLLCAPLALLPHHRAHCVHRRALRAGVAVLGLQPGRAARPQRVGAALSRGRARAGGEVRRAAPGVRPGVLAPVLRAAAAF